MNTERTLRAIEERYAALARASAQIVWTTPADGMVDDMPLWRAYTGQTPGEVRGWGWLDAIHPDDRAATARVWADAVRDRSVYETEYRVRRHDGEYRPFLVRGVPVLDADGAIREWVGFCADITERKRMEAALHASEARFRALVQQSGDLIAVTDAGGTLRYLSPAAEPILGAPPEELVGKNALAPVHPEDRPAVEAHFLTSRAQPGVSLPPIRYRVRRRDGSTRLLEATTNNRLDDPEVAGFIITSRDITVWQGAEDRQRFLAEASAVLADSLDYEATLARVARLSVPRVADWCAVDIVGEDGAVRRLAIAHRDPDKEPALLELSRRYPPAAAQPSPILQALRTGAPIFIPEITEEARRALVHDEEHLRLTRIVGLSAGMVVPLQARGKTLGTLSFVGAGERRYTPDDLALARDLAYRAALAVDNARLYQDAREAVAARDRFISIASHELRTPVTKVRGYTELLIRAHRAAAPDPERLARYLGVLDATTRRLAAMTEELLDVSRLRMGQLPLRLQPLDLAALVREIALRYEETLDTGHRLMLADDTAPCPVVADADRLEQVISNLLENAVKYSPPGGAIGIAVETAGDGALLTVRDEGIGLPGDLGETIFEPFRRTPEAIERQIPGLGLGLSICRDIVERHGGRIWAESAGAGRGTTMRVRLPPRPAPGEAAPPAPQ